MKITNFSIKRPITILMGIIAVMIFGVVSYSKLNLDMLPSIDLPMVMVMTQSYGTGPEEIEDSISKPLEGVLATVDNVKSINSVSSEGSSMIMVEFEEGTDMNFASLDMREKVDLIKSTFPEGTMSPMIMKLNPSMMPVMNFGVSIEGLSEAEITEWADKVLIPTLEGVEGVASTDVMGGVQSKVKIKLDSDKLASKGLTIATVMQSIRANNMSIPIGNIQEGDYEILVRTNNKLESVKDIEDILISTYDGKTIPVKDVGNVEVVHERGNNIAKINGENALLISLQKESNANTVVVSNAVNEALDKLKGEKGNLEIITILDQAQFIQFAVDSVKSNAIVGAILAIIIILLFLKDLRTTLVMALSIPISVISTFILIYFAGLTLNLISLGGIALGVGMLVDNSIVVIENIYRLKKKGYSNHEAALKGTTEVGMAISASTLTTICVFLPIVFVEGIAADIFKEMALTVTFSLISSLVVAFTLVPLLASRLLSKDNLDKENKMVDKLRGLYRKALNWSLENRGKVVAIILLVITLGGISFTAIGLEFFPTSDQGVVMINVKTPKGGTLESLNDICLEAEKKVANLEGVDTTAIISQNGGATLYLVLEKKEDRKVSDKDVMKNAREALRGIAGAKFEVSSSGGTASLGGSPVSISISGESFKELDRITDDVVKRMEKVKGIKDIKKSNEKNADEIRINVDKKKAEEYGLSSGTIASLIQGNFKETDLSTVTIDDKKYNLVISPGDGAEKTLLDLENMTLTNVKGAKIPLKEVATLDRGEGYSKINRGDGLRKVTITAAIEGRALGDIVNDVKEELSTYNIPDGYKISYEGEIEQMEEAFSQLFLALILAVVLVYMVMAAQFESLISPFIIMFTVPLAFVGGLLSLFAFGVTLSIPALIGFVMLTGIIVNNGIVLIDYINKRIEDGLPLKEAILEAGTIRLQPILMTALTTIIGLVPMAIGIGEGAEIITPLALTVVGGLTLGTLLTLIVVPVVFSLVQSAKYKIMNRN